MSEPIEPELPDSQRDDEEDSADPFSVQLPAGTSPNASLDAVLPVAIFLLLNRFLGLGWAIVGATAWSIKSLISRQRSGLPIGKFLPVVMVLIIGRGVIGLVTDSETVYFGLGIAAKYALALGLVVTVLIGRNAVARLAPYAFGFGPAVTGAPSYQSATAHITIVGALYYFASATFDIWLLGSGSTERYVLVRTGVNWVSSSVVLVGCAIYLARRLREIDGFPGLVPVFERRVEQQAAAFGWDISDPDGSVRRVPRAERSSETGAGAEDSGPRVSDTTPDGDATPHS